MTRRGTRTSLLSRVASRAGVVLVAAVALSGCGLIPVPEPRSSTSSPTTEDVAPDLARYYEQVLAWSPCEDGAQCATATAPLDWSAPDPATDIQLALTRHAARGSDGPRGRSSSTPAARAPPASTS
ncbi:hypothetical protein CMsap09_04730 [Clavibacter michiganensis]|uniref:Alpha/beta hydrolase n=1 Tax=Clavibacter michiganensis TaxID=28447 RepID=A0A251XRQ5_9MICO|nr:hypothetical protein CMsap09_04730 [Clavibacter michiganensis]